VSPIDALPAIRIVATAFDDLLDDLMFVGGAVTGLLVTDPAAPPSRLTDDIDVVVDIATYAGYTRLVERLRTLGFAEDTSEGAPTCRWIIHGLKVDVMSTGPTPGPTNRWYAEAIACAQLITLDDRISARIITAPFFIADKLETFGDGRRGDYLSSHDIEDIIAVIDGRETIAADVLAAPVSVREFVVDRLRRLLSDSHFIDAVAGHLPGDSASQARLPLVLSRMRAIAAVG